MHDNFVDNLWENPIRIHPVIFPTRYHNRSRRFTYIKDGCDRDTDAESFVFDERLIAQNSAGGYYIQCIMRRT